MHLHLCKVPNCSNLLSVERCRELWGQSNGFCSQKSTTEMSGGAKFGVNIKRNQNNPGIKGNGREILKFHRHSS